MRCFFDLASRNSDLAVWFGSHSQHSCAYEFLDGDMRRLGVCSSNSSEQANSFLESTRGKPICDIVRDVIKKMSDDRFHRGRKAIELINDGQKLTSYALSAHSSIVCGQTRYYAIRRRWLQMAASPALFVGAQGKRNTGFARLSRMRWSAHSFITKN